MLAEMMFSCSDVIFIGWAVAFIGLAVHDKNREGGVMWPFGLWLGAVGLVALFATRAGWVDLHL